MYKYQSYNLCKNYFIRTNRMNIKAIFFCVCELNLVMLKGFNYFKVKVCSYLSLYT